MPDETASPASPRCGRLSAAGRRGRVPARRRGGESLRRGARVTVARRRAVLTARSSGPTSSIAGQEGGACTRHPIADRLPRPALEALVKIGERLRAGPELRHPGLDLADEGCVRHPLVERPSRVALEPMVEIRERLGGGPELRQPIVDRTDGARVFARHRCLPFRRRAYGASSSPTMRLPPIRTSAFGGLRGRSENEGVGVRARRDRLGWRSGPIRPSYGRRSCASHSPGGSSPSRCSRRAGPRFPRADSLR